MGIPTLPAITLRKVEATSTTNETGSTGTTTIGYLKVGNTVVIGQLTAVAPNTTLNLGLVKLVLNEQTPFSTPDKGLTVNAIHITATTLLANANIVVASAESDLAELG